MVILHIANAFSAFLFVGTGVIQSAHPNVVQLSTRCNKLEISNLEIKYYKTLIGQIIQPFDWFHKHTKFTLLHFFR